MAINVTCATQGHSWTREYLDGPNGTHYQAWVCTRCGEESLSRPPSSLGGAAPAQQLELLHGTATPVYRPEEGTE